MFGVFSFALDRDDPFIQAIAPVGVAGRRPFMPSGCLKVHGTRGLICITFELLLRYKCQSGG